MKVVYPKHIKKGIFGTMNFQVWPFTISIIQLFILAAGIALSLGVFNAVGQESRAVGIIFAIPIFLIFVVIAFFEVSELPLIPFIAKLMKTYFFDATKKFQVNYEKPDRMQVLIKEAASQEKTQVIEYKTETDVAEETLESIEKWWLLW
jgi:hypothetical protein